MTDNTDKLGHYNMGMLYVNIDSNTRQTKTAHFQKRNRSPLMAFGVMVIGLTGVSLVASSSRRTYFDFIN